MLRNIKSDETLDLIGVTCPQNSAKVLLKLESMAVGSVLQIIIDTGEPFKNIMAVVKEEGHRIIKQKKEDKRHIIFIEKA